MEKINNIKIEIKNDILYLEIDLTKDYGESKSGKSNIIATTRGNVKLPEYDKKDIIIGVNCYTPIPKKPKTEKQAINE